jgi:hypothetical protein
MRRCNLASLLGDFVARQLRDGSRLRLDGHLAVSLRNIARAMPLNGVQNAMLNADGLEAMLPQVAGRNHGGRQPALEPVPIDLTLFSRRQRNNVPADTLTGQAP